MGVFCGCVCWFVGCVVVSSDCCLSLIALDCVVGLNSCGYDLKCLFDWLGFGIFRVIVSLDC